MKKKSLFSTRPLHNVAPNRSVEVLVRLINTSTDTPVSLLLRITRWIGEDKQITLSQITVEPAQSALREFIVGDAGEYQVTIEADAPHILITVWGVDAQRRVVENHRVLHSEMSWVR